MTLFHITADMRRAYATSRLEAVGRKLVATEEIQRGLQKAETKNARLTRTGASKIQHDRNATNFQSNICLNSRACESRNLMSGSAK